MNMTRKIRVMTFSSIALSWLSYCFNRILTLAKTTECLINSHLLAVYRFYNYLCSYCVSLLARHAISLSKMPTLKIQR